MKVSIKRGQSQAGLSFAERENQRSAAVGKAKVRPQVKRKLLFIFALLLALAQGAWAQTTTYTSYTVTGGSVSYWPSCEHDKLLDNNTGTKWCTVFGDGPRQPRLVAIGSTGRASWRVWLPFFCPYSNRCKNQRNGSDDPFSNGDGIKQNRSHVY